MCFEVICVQGSDVCSREWWLCFEVMDCMGFELVAIK
jgi:hypothetical protein